MRQVANTHAQFANTTQAASTKAIVETMFASMEFQRFNVGREWTTTAHSVLKNGDHAGRRCGSIRRTC